MSETRASLMSDLQKLLCGRPLTAEERESHIEAGASFHVPAIVHRSGGTSAQILNACGICGAQIAFKDGNWVALTDEEADAIRAKARRKPVTHDRLYEAAWNLARAASVVLDAFRSGQNPTFQQLDRLESTLIPWTNLKLCGHHIAEDCSCDPVIKFESKAKRRARGVSR